jgi:hypothetical protein
MTSYATLDETYNLALTARAFEVAPSPLVTVEIATGKIRLPAHGYGAADLILFSATSGGSLPAELDAFTYYSPIIIGGDVFKVAHPDTGLPIIFTTTPSGWAVKVDPARRLTLHLRDAFGRINNSLTAHKTPILVDPNTGLYPEILVGTNARMGARGAVTSLQIENPAYRVALDRLKASEAEDNANLVEWKMGKSILPTPTDQNTIADMGPRARNRFSAGSAAGSCGCPSTGYGSSRWERRTL